MKGYRFPLGMFIQITEDLLVKCNRCNNTWLETVTHNGIIAGYAQYYDICDKCITVEELKAFQK